MNGIQENQPLQSAQNVNPPIGTKKKLTQERLRELLDYDPRTGIFIWKRKRGSKAAGSIAGGPDLDGYILISIDRVRYKAHRLAFFWMLGYFPENDVDHIDRITSNNRWKNLREASRSCNNINGRVRKNSLSGVTGVTWDKNNKRWIAKITHSKKGIYLGSFMTIAEAASVRLAEEKKYGYPGCNSTSPAYKYLKNHEDHNATI